MSAGKSAPSLPSSRLWILDPWRDMGLFVLAPLWILPLIWWAKAGFGVNTFGAVALALGAVGHHLPGFIRAYTNPALFRRFRARLIGAPVFFVAVALAFSLLNLHGLQVLLLLWGVWHGAMQINGFLRIYDAKAGSLSALTARLDWAMCLAWFGAGLLHSSTRVTAILMSFYGAGGTGVIPGAFLAFRLAWDVMTAAITIAFLVNSWRQTRAGNPPSPVKFLLMLSSFSFWWFAMVAVENPILGLLLFEIFHDIQYNALVWIQNRARLQGSGQGLEGGRVEAFLFRPGTFPILFYALLVLGYGSLGVISGYADVHAPGFLRASVGNVNVWTALFMISTFLHFYFDGFIWRVRDPEIREGLGIAQTVGQGPAVRRFESTRAGWLPNWLPNWKWAFFVVPAVLLAIFEIRGSAMPVVDRYRNLVQILPDSWSINFLLAGEEKAGGNAERAAAHYARVIALDPDFQPAHRRLAEIFDGTGQPDRALPHYRRAVELHPADTATRALLANMLLARARIAEALPHMMVLVSGAPHDTNLIYLTGAALMHERRFGEAIPYLRRALDLNPAQPKAWSYLGIAARALGDTVAAEVYYQRAVALDPRFARRE